MSAITVNGETIPESAIARETQYHSADNLDGARHKAATTLVLRRLMLQRAAILDIPGAQALAAGEAEPAEPEEGGAETLEEAVIRRLLEAEIATPEADEAACRRYYESNKDRLATPTRYRCAHILLAADPQDRAAREMARDKAAGLIADLRESPGRFAELARLHSHCPSREQDGELGTVSTRELVREFATFLEDMAPPQLCPEPVPSRYGFHVLRLDAVYPGRVPPFEEVAGKIREFLTVRSWETAVQQYMKQLVGAAEITGIELSGADSPLVQ